MAWRRRIRPPGGATTTPGRSLEGLIGESGTDTTGLYLGIAIKGKGTDPLRDTIFAMVSHRVAPDDRVETTLAEGLVVTTNPVGWVYSDAREDSLEALAHCAPARRAGAFIVHPDVNPIPQPMRGGRWRVDGYCPGEYCKYDAWRLLRGVTIRSRPTPDADSIGFLRPGSVVRADSGFALVDRPGLLVITTPPPPLDFAPYRPPFEVGDTVVVLNPRSEGYWNVVWRRCITISYGYWEGAETAGARVVRKPTVHWWVHANSGWILMDGVSFRSAREDNE
jgi:hypothetical protein